VQVLLRARISCCKARLGRYRDSRLRWSQSPVVIGSAAIVTSPSGQLLFNAEFPAGVNSYRAYRQPWPAHPGQRH
jgi:hypothetical protein